MCIHRVPVCIYRVPVCIHRVPVCIHRVPVVCLQCRMCAVFGGMYCLRRQVTALVLDESRRSSNV